MPANASIVSRRGFLTGRTAPEPAFVRPPWTDDASLREKCTGCGDCIRACPEAILISDDRRFPRVELNGGECTFCGGCATACNAGVFDLARSPAWPVTVALTSDCLMEQGISCRLCTDICDRSALCFDMSVRPVGAVSVETESCTGCGICIGVCPVDAIELVDRRQEARA